MARRLTIGSCAARGLRNVWKCAILFGSYWIPIPPEHRLEDASGVPGFQPQPALSGIPPLHPERLHPNSPLSATEQRLQQEMSHECRQLSRLLR